MDGSDGASPRAGRVRLSRLAAVFAWTGLTSVGGGRYAFFYDALVVRRPWLRSEEFLWLSLICVGGGLGVVPEMQRQVVDRFHWVTAQQFLDGYALSQLTPGPNMLVVVFLGYGAHGVIGGLVALLAMFLPTSVLAALIARHWAALRHRAWAVATERALLPVGIGLMAAGVYTLARSGIRDVPAAIIALVAAAVLWTGRVPAMLVVLAAGAIGWLAAT